MVRRLSFRAFLLVTGASVTGCLGVQVTTALNDAGKGLGLKRKPADCGAPLFDKGDKVAPHTVVAEIVLEDPGGFTLSDRNEVKKRLVTAACEVGADAVLLREPGKRDGERGPVVVRADAISYGGHATEAGASKPSEQTVQGTCFAANDDGTLVTAAHVVADAKAIKVRFPKKDPVPAKVVAQSSADDVAVLKIDQATPRFLPLAPSSRVKPGTRVFTIGFPVSGLLGDDPKFTDGVVSSMSGIGGERRLMQVSVPIQPGNSGGPLVSESGFAVGVVTSTAAVETFFKATGSLPQGVNWAVKADLALPLFDAHEQRTTDVERDEAVALANDAICQVVAEVNPSAAKAAAAKPSGAEAKPK
jgi:S1-C subfamily serine protease